MTTVLPLLYDSAKISSTDCENPMSNILSTSSITTCLETKRVTSILGTTPLGQRGNQAGQGNGLKPIASTYFSWERSRVPLTMWSRILPGVPTITSSPAFIAATGKTIIII